MSAPKSLRMHIGIFGRRNVGKSSLLNAVTRQNVSIVSPQAGATTDPVEKPMELLPLGPVLFIDTAGLDDEGELGEQRVERTRRIFDRCDLGLILTDGEWADSETEIVEALEKRGVPWMAVLTKADEHDHSALVETLRGRYPGKTVLPVAAGNADDIERVSQAIISDAPASFLENRAIVGDLVPEGAHVVLVVPIDKEAPRGRLIMPQVQTIRDLLDAHCVCTVCQEPQLRQVLQSFREPPALVVTDSQAFAAVSEIVPPSIPLTGFSVLFARYKGDLKTLVAGARSLETLRPGDRILIAEACTHHPVQDDIGRDKIPRWLQQHCGGELQIDVVSGQEFPTDLTPYHTIIHCGACMWTRRQFLSRLRAAAAQNVPITNYGIAIAFLKGILPRALQPFDLQDE